MTGVTFAVTVMFAIFAMVVRPGTAIGLIICSMMVWPEYLRIPVGPAAMSAPRLIALVLLLRLWMSRNRSFKFNTVDMLVILGWLWTIVANILASSGSGQVSQMIGRGFDTVLMYFVARYALMTASDAKGMLSPLALTALFMAVMGALESAQIFSPYSKLAAFRGWQWIVETESELRFGFTRALGSTSQPIYFGMAMMLITGLLWSMRGYSKSFIIHPGSSIAGIFGAFTSLSSGPLIGCAMLVFFNAFVKRISLIRPALWGLLALLILIEIASNRHFYNLIDYIAINKQNAWYRTRLLEVAFAQWREFWLFGMGGATPNHWGQMIDGRWYVDLVNHFIILSLYGGLINLILYVAAHVLAVKAAVRTWRSSPDERHKIMVFGFAATLIALDATSMSVGIFGPAVLLSYMLLGFLVSATGALR